MSQTLIDYMEYSTDALAQAAYANDTTLVTVVKSTAESSTWTVPTGVYSITVQCWGGGASGGGTNNAFVYSGGGGGGGGAYSIRTFAVTPGDVISYVVAASVAGVSAANGNNGNTTYFKSNDSSGCVAVGGSYGAYLSNGAGAGGKGGLASSCYGDLKYSGGDGGTGTNPNSSGGGGGGAGSTGAGGSASGGTKGTGTSYGGGDGGAGITSGSSNGNTGSNYGGGGGGGRASGSAGVKAGGTGAQGLIQINYFPLQSFSEATIKTQGSYSLKASAVVTSSLNKTLTRTIASPIDLSSMSSISFDIYALRTGANIKIGIKDSGGTITEITPSVITSNSWQTITWDISAVSNVNKDAIDSIIITVVNADSDNLFYIDNMYAYKKSFVPKVIIL
ncbi:MAG: hypothetical protein LLF83_04815 [Methanobacterium sp.]|nr:hypothetical protein [Methanobacterium sp.]